LAASFYEFGGSFQTFQTHFHSLQGWAIISSIEDTIKCTTSTDPRATLQNTFVSSAKLIPGMPEVYQHLSKALDCPALVYLSGCPVNMLPYLNGFIRDNYPTGTILLRNDQIRYQGEILRFLTQGLQALKMNCMNYIYDQFPVFQLLSVAWHLL
jgi:phosphatidate phosphatase APP1